MKKVLYIFICGFIIIALLFSVLALHGSKTVNRVGENMYAIYVNDCALGSVKMNKSFFGVTIEAENCDGPNSGGHGYSATLFAHFFWIGR